MDNPGYRNLVAAVGAQSFILELLFKQTLGMLSKSQRKELAEAIIAASLKTDQFTDIAKGDDIAAERLSDTVILMQGRVKQYVENALEACEKLEDGTTGQGQ